MQVGGLPRPYRRRTEPETHRGGEIFYWDVPQFQVKAFHLQMPDVMSFRLVSGGRWWFIVSCYLDPDDASTIENIVVAISQLPRGDVLLVAVYFNAELAASEGNCRREDIAALIATKVL